MATKVNEGCSGVETPGYLGFPCCQIKVAFPRSTVWLLIRNITPTFKDDMHSCLPLIATSMVMEEGPSDYQKPLIMDLCGGDDCMVVILYLELRQDMIQQL